MLVLCHDFAECGPNSTVAQMNTSFKSQPVCRTRLPDTGQQDGSHLPGQRSLQAGLGDLQNRRHESGMGCWSGA
jgi:hypothetical protein